MNFIRTLTATAAATTLVGALGFVYAQTSSTDPANSSSPPNSSMAADPAANSTTPNSSTRSVEESWVRKRRFKRSS